MSRESVIFHVGLQQFVALFFFPLLLGSFRNSQLRQNDRFICGVPIRTMPRVLIAISQIGVQQSTSLFLKAKFLQ